MIKTGCAGKIGKATSPLLHMQCVCVKFAVGVCVYFWLKRVSFTACAGVSGVAKRPILIQSPLLRMQCVSGMAKRPISIWSLLCMQCVNSATKKFNQFGLLTVGPRSGSSPPVLQRYKSRAASLVL